MSVIARALIQQTRLLEHAGEPLELEDVEKILESLAETLQEASPEDVQTLRRTLDEMAQEEARAARPSKLVLEFYRTFLANVGIRK